ncbi:MAG: 3alpha(or 20beta)-hydroxysteroid dehydrogenase [Epulopiscium sp.]|jgi:3alpha(or 20beta)-hydroxysteroid dehydrogenase|uniref:Glucose 1-dehydrogenase n=1 Tax=Defluviitalea raffinosedens TaxID=1450156 RepID=A0A7C8LFN5_9FIRM|nr:glucose 1-dehydrogenase [Defluviitalea raffinosedens]MBZ4666999.1 3-alpha-hydroxysteroid dehydrogenase [Defluviitaleaceae bacterium]MDK2786805.1 3alpha(or 20beta)-hydroxysteroid dehydrogenase [Candidatus Epulonipiscium sp.]KAE9635640.1 glucose 1-dehydrogenase [Defluviitalea raffinosedens]MBM7684561.1 3alpha(or 20beta)-hydroxysteroid dehydrogenase [Defluviitalea raffinosedens]HHW68336.1 glucose 1-dehydrogenase [Candidatus Epulonipiscium sp.]
MKRLENKVAIITGAAQGMGAAHAKLFVEEGAKVVLTDLNEEKGQAVAAELGENAIFVKQDVTSEEDWKVVVAKAEEVFGPVNILVNNAGISVNKSIMDMSLEEYRRIVDINQVSVFLGMRAVVPSMEKAGKGSIINVSSINGLVGGAIGYTDTKFAVRGMTKAAAIELTRKGIRVNSVHPGVIATPMIQQEDAKDAIEEFAKFIPLKRIAQPEEVSNMVLFLASDESSYSTGSEFVVDGGLTAQ